MFLFFRTEVEANYCSFPCSYLELEKSRDRLFFGGWWVFFFFFFNFPKTSETQNIVTLSVNKLKLSYSFLLPVPPLAAAPSLR